MRHNAFKFCWILVFFLGLLLLWSAAPLAAGPPAEEQVASDTGEEPAFIAYYFYTSKRCGPCRRIENWSQTAIRENFQQAMADGRLEWRAVNVEKPENKHFVEDFGLYTKSLIIVEQKNGEPVRWENLEDVWQLYRDKEKYFNYVSSKTQAFMEKH